MSYILDALRKADAERDRGNVPGIHAQPSFGGAAPLRAQPAARPALWLAAGALAVFAVAAVAWYWMSAPSAPNVSAPNVSAPNVSAPSVGAPNVPAPNVSGSALTAPAAQAPLPSALGPAPVAPPTVQAAAPKPEAAITPRRPRPVPAPEPGAPAAVDAKAAAVGERVYLLAELPDDIRRQLPAVNVGGSMYSAKPADRVLIVNGQVLHEGDRIAPDLTLQQIRLKGALLSFKGYRYTVAF